MTKEEIIEMARQAGFERLGHTAEDWVCHLEDIEEFTKLVAEKERDEPPPIQRTWVGLTDEEIGQGCKESWVTEQAFESAVWWAEEKLRKKNT